MVPRLGARLSVQGTPDKAPSGSASSSVAAAYLRSVWILIVGLVVVLATGVGVAYWLMRSIAMPLFRLVDLLAVDVPK